MAHNEIQIGASLERVFAVLSEPRSFTSSPPTRALLERSTIPVIAVPLAACRALDGLVDQPRYSTSANSTVPSAQTRYIKR